MKNFFLSTLIIFVFLSPGLAQYDWLYVDSLVESASVLSLLEKDNGHFIVTTNNIGYQIKYTKLLDFDPDGILLEEKIIEDTAIHIYSSFPHPDGYLLLGRIHDSLDYYHLYSVVMDDDNTVVSEHINEEPVEELTGIRGQLINDTTIAAYWLESDSVSCVALLNRNGEIVKSQKRKLNSYINCAIGFSPRLDSVGYVEASLSHFYFYDEDLNYKWEKPKYPDDWDNSVHCNLRIFNEHTYFDYFDYYKPEFGFFRRVFGARFRDIHLESDTNQITNIPKPDYWAYPAATESLEDAFTPSYRGADWIDKNHIYVSGTYGYLQNLTEPKCMVVSRLDSNLSIVWTRFIGLERDKYIVPISVTATTDLGCIIGGMIKGLEYSYNMDAFIMKINADGTTVIDDKDADYIDIVVFPNPSNDIFKININSCAQDDLSINLTNELGRTIYSNLPLQKGENIFHWSHLPQGVYFYSITTKNNTIGSGSWVKVE